MCGMVGVVGKDIKKEHTTWFEQALYADALRGWDSTGMAIVDSASTTPFVYKKAMVPSDFQDTRRYHTTLGKAHKAVALLGHNRAATAGKVNNKGAHPFTHDNITLTHNGTLWGHRDMPGCNEFSVDSEAVCYSISKRGPKDTLSDMAGAWCLAYHNKDDGTFNLVRNNERPMFYAYVAKLDVFLYASEKGLLEWLATRNKIAIETPIELPEDMHTSFDLEGDLRSPVVEKMEGDWYSGNWGNTSGMSSRKKQSNAMTKHSGNNITRTLFVRDIGYSWDQIVDLELTNIGNIYANNAGVATWEGIVTTPPKGGDGKYSGPYKCKIYSQSIDNFDQGAMYEGKISTVYCDGVDSITVIMESRTVKQTYTSEEVERIFIQEPPFDDDVTVCLGEVFMSAKDAKKILDGGCTYCSDDISMDQLDEVITVDGEPLCPDCASLWNTIPGAS